MTIEAKVTAGALSSFGGSNGVGATRYLPVAEHGLIGDLRSAALVGTNGTIDWYCCSRAEGLLECGGSMI